MAILCLATDLDDLRRRIENIIPVSYTHLAIVARMGTDVVVQGTARCLVRQVAGQIIQYASAGKTVGAYHQYFLSCH